MATRLKFNWKALYDDLTARLVEVTNELIDEIYRGVTSKLSPDGQIDSEKEEAVYKPLKKTITAQCVFYAQAIVESFGIGDKADSSSESYWREYQNNSPFWNYLRFDKTIVGREKGSYIDMWGQRQKSAGRSPGVPTGNKGSYGNRAIQAVEAWVIQNGETKIERRLTVEIDKFFQGDMSKYFKQVGR